MARRREGEWEYARRTPTGSRKETTTKKNEMEEMIEKMEEEETKEEVEEEEGEVREEVEEEMEGRKKEEKERRKRKKVMWRRKPKGEERTKNFWGYSLEYGACGAERSGHRLEYAGWLHAHQWGGVLAHPRHHEGRQF